jgi:hypothetical protein
MRKAICFLLLVLFLFSPFLYASDIDWEWEAGRMYLKYFGEKHTPDCENRVRMLSEKMQKAGQGHFICTGWCKGPYKDDFGVVRFNHGEHGHAWIKLPNGEILDPSVAKPEGWYVQKSIRWVSP